MRAQRGHGLTTEAVCAAVAQFEKSQECLFLFLGEFITLLGSRVLDQLVRVKSLCMTMFNRDSKSRCKVALFSPLKAVMTVPLNCERARRDQLATELEISLLSSRLLDKLQTQASKHSGTVKGQVLHVLGIMSETFPVEFTGRDATLLQVYMSFLRANMQGSRKPDMPVIVGCLRGLLCFLVHFTQPYEAASSTSTRAKEIFQFVSKAITLPADLKRFEIPRCGLRLLARHADQFRELISEVYERLFSTIVGLCDHSNKQMKDAAFSALNAVMKELSASIVDNGKDHPQSSRMFRYLFKAFRDMMEDHSSGARKVSIAIRG